MEKTLGTGSVWMSTGQRTSMSDTNSGVKEKNSRGKKRPGCIKRTVYSTAVPKKIFDSERSNNTSGSSLKVLDTALQNKIGELLILKGHD